MEFKIIADSAILCTKKLRPTLFLPLTMPSPSALLPSGVVISNGVQNGNPTSAIPFVPKTCPLHGVLHMLVVVNMAVLPPVYVKTTAVTVSTPSSLIIPWADILMGRSS